MEVLQSAAPSVYDVQAIRRDFPILARKDNGHPLIWLDNGATTQKPQVVIDRCTKFYSEECSNLYRSVHFMAALAEDAYDGARERVRQFLNARSVKECVFTRGTTEGINLVAYAWGRQNVHAGDEIVITGLEQHANIMPWLKLCQEVGAKLVVAPADENGDLILEEYEKLVCSRTKLVSFTQVANSIGSVLPAKEMVAIAHRHGAVALVDGAQAVAHMGVDVQDLDCDFYVFSGHKIYGPTGIGVLYGKESLFEAMDPWQVGGSAVPDIGVEYEKMIYNVLPKKHEAGTGNHVGAIGLVTALDYVTGIGLANIARHEEDVLGYLVGKLQTVPGLRLIGWGKHRSSIVSFIFDGMTAYEDNQRIGQTLSANGICLRASHHCSVPTLRHFGLKATVRPTLGMYNTREEMDVLVSVLRTVSKK